MIIISIRYLLSPYSKLLSLSGVGRTKNLQNMVEYKNFV